MNRFLYRTTSKIQPLLYIPHASIIKCHQRSLSSTSIVDGFESLITWTHSSMGLPWWLSIAVSTLAIRSVITAPLQLKLQSRIQRFKSTQNLLKAWKSSLKNKSKTDSLRASRQQKPSSDQHQIQEQTAISVRIYLYIGSNFKKHQWPVYFMLTFNNLC